MQRVDLAGLRARVRHSGGRVAVVLGIAATQFVAHGALDSGSTHAQPSSLPQPKHPILGTGTAKPTLGWATFCAKFPVECAVDLSEPEVITLTQEQWQTILAINTRVNRSVKPKSDREHWGVEDR